ncbi:sugar ABC transporter permease [Gordoniibacillus kamchatkensis]|uniref:Sugar ABC transporter permease n=1 Tax=Gordoniibacillus kamchatkensis TaxID=1590651 RepID=A0ABR5ANF5_9BACL|nr:carbohydrate ABC transporter permease [Paenibacillus sp. VKM B-2647]KIL42500.1 sugar ABC transporter permease [Paenibacillus sp. VKM B-2647]
MNEPKWRTGLRYVILILFLGIILLPMIWMVITSFKPDLELGLYPPSLVPQSWTGDHYMEAFQKYNFGIYIRNSVIISVISTTLVIILSSLAAFAIALLPVRGKTIIMMALLIISMFPAVAVVTPLYMLLRTLGWLNSFQALIIPYTAFNLPFAIWILRNYFAELPKDLFEAARVDGATVLQTFYQIFVPLTRPGLFTATVFTFISTWTEFFMALVFNQSKEMRTIPVGIALFNGQFYIPYGTIFAGSIVAILPIILITIVFRKWVVSGLTSGAVKG